jgi:hypothetical protein
MGGVGVRDIGKKRAGAAPMSQPGGSGADIPEMSRMIVIL